MQASPKEISGFSGPPETAAVGQSALEAVGEAVGEAMFHAGGASYPCHRAWKRDPQKPLDQSLDATPKISPELLWADGEGRTSSEGSRQTAACRSDVEVAMRMMMPSPDGPDLSAARNSYSILPGNCIRIRVDGMAGDEWLSPEI